MPSALRRLGVFLFCFGGLAVVVALTPVAAALVGARQEQVQWAAALVGGLMAVSGLVMDWLGSQAIRDEAQNAGGPPSPVQNANNPQASLANPPAMRLSSSPKTGKGYREDLMA
jgi:hypothetical protein